MGKTVNLRQIGVRSAPLFTVDADNYYALEAALLDVAPEQMASAFVTGCPDCVTRYLFTGMFIESLDILIRELSDNWSLEKMALKKRPHIHARLFLDRLWRKNEKTDGRVVKKMGTEIVEWINAGKDSQYGSCHTIRFFETPTECKHEAWPRSDEDLHGKSF